MANEILYIDFIFVFLNEFFRDVPKLSIKENSNDMFNILEQIICFKEQNDKSMEETKIILSSSLNKKMDCNVIILCLDLAVKNNQCF